MRMVRSSLALLLCLILLAGLLPPEIRALPPEDFPEDVFYIQGDYVGFAVKTGGEQNGRFTIGNVEGNPNYTSDNDQILLFGHPCPWSSFTTLRVDGQELIFQTDQVARSESGRSITAWLEYDGIKITQLLELVHNPRTGLDDTVQISYRAEALDERTREIDLRILLDTMLGGNDGAPFKVPGLGNVTMERDLVSQRIDPQRGLAALPSFYQAYDDLENAEVFAIGTLVRRGFLPPDRVTFASWSGIYDESQPWDYAIDHDTAVTGDSAVALWWEGHSLRAGAPLTFTTWYGVGYNDCTASLTDTTVQIPENGFAVLAVDEDALPVSGVTIKAPDLPGAPVAVTSQEGVAVFPALEQEEVVTRLRAEKTGCCTVQTEQGVHRGELAMVRIFPDDGLPHLISARAEFRGRKTDLLQSTLCLRRDAGKEQAAPGGENTEQLTIRLEALGIEDGDTWRLIQQNRVAAGADRPELTLTVFNGPKDDPGGFGENPRVQGLRAGEPVRLQVLDSAGTVLLDKELGLMISEPVLYEKADDPFSFSFGDLKFTVPEEVPLIGGGELELGLEHVPVAVELLPDNTLRIAINPIYSENTGTSVGKKKIDWKATEEAFQKAMSEKSLWNPPASGFHAGICKVDCKVSGYVEGKLGAGNSAAIDVGVVVQVKAGASKSYTVLLGYVPVYVAASGELDVTASTELQSSYSNGQFRVTGGMGEFNPQLTFALDAGVGVYDVLSLGASGRVILDWLNRYDGADNTFYNKVDVTAGLYLVAQALCFKYEKDLAEGTWTVWEDGPSPARRSAGIAGDLYDTSCYVPIPRTRGSAAKRDLWSSALVSDVYPDARPKLIRAGDRSYLFWLSEAEDRADPDRTALTYSVCSDWGWWSDPVQVLPEDSESTADLDFDAAWDGSRIRIALSKANRRFGSETVTMEDVARSAELWTLSLEPQGEEGLLELRQSRRLTDNDWADLMPAVTAAGNRTDLAWVENRLEGGLFGGGSTQTVHHRQIRNGEMTGSEQTPQGLVRSLSLGALNGEITLAWVTDTDRDYHTDADTVLELSKPNGTPTALPVPGVSQPVFAGGVLHYGTPEGPMTRSAPDAEARPVFAGDVPQNYGGSFFVLEGEGVRRLFWTVSGESTTQLWGLTAEGDGWTPPYLADEKLTNDNRDALSRITGYLLDGRDYFAMTAHNPDYESTDLLAAEQIPGSRLVLDAVVYDENAAVPGGTIPMELTVSNAGERTAENLQVYLDREHVYPLEGVLQPGQTRTFSLAAFPVPEELEAPETVSFYVESVMDEGGSEAEGTVTLGRADLAVTAERLCLEGRDWARLRVENLGAVAVPGILRLMCDAPDGAVLFETRLDAVEPDANYEILLDLDRLRGEMHELDTFYGAVSAVGVEDRAPWNNSDLLFTGAGRPQQYALRLEAGPGGRIPGSPDSLLTPETAVTVRAEADFGWRFDHWELDGGGSLADAARAETTFTSAAENAVLTAVFTRSMPFADVPETAYYADAVLWAVSNGITQGTGPAAFSPGAGCTRAQVVTFLWRAAGCPEPEQTAAAAGSFSDVPASAYYAKAVAWAVERGITAGVSRDRFAPGSTCTRGQIVTFLWRAAGCPVPGASDAVKTGFSDVPASAYYAKAVTWAVERGITAGVSRDRFAPGNTCTRAQVVTFLYRSAAK